MSHCSLCAFWKSSIGKKIVVAVTGLMMVLFLAGHLVGNLLIFSGPEAFNEYAKFLHELGHGKAIWLARIGLLAAIALHIAGTVQLTLHNRKASPAYENDASMRATKSSTWMIWSGSTILLFVIFHILQFTTRSTDKTLATLGDSGDAYAMVIHGFSNFFVVVFYVAAIVCLCSHLSHGVASIFQTLGLRTKKTSALIDYGSKAYTAVMLVGFISIPLAIFIFRVGRPYLNSLGLDY